LYTVKERNGKAIDADAPIYQFIELN